MAAMQGRLRAPHHRRDRGARTRFWCFTSFMGDDWSPNFDEKVVRYVVYQRECCAETKKKHYQGYIELFENLRMGQVKKILGDEKCHLEPRRGSRTAARDYCQKFATRILGTQVCFGTWRVDPSRKRKLCDMLARKADGTYVSLDDLIEESPVSYVRFSRGLDKLDARRKRKLAKVFRKVKVLVYVGPTGSGKTRKACSFPNHFKKPFSCGTSIWFDNYNDEKVLIIDDFYGDIKYGTLLQILDGYELQLPVKGAYVWAMWTTVIITSNVGPDQWYSKAFPNGASPALLRRITRIVHFPIPPHPLNQLADVVIANAFENPIDLT